MFINTFVFLLKSSNINRHFKYYGIIQKLMNMPES
jgi:hypothetical protein